MTNQTTGERGLFLADRWLDAKSGTTTVTLDNASGGAGTAAVHRWKVAVRTGDERGAGTDADVSIILIGANGKTAELPLESSADNFERNKARLSARAPAPLHGCSELAHCAAAAGHPLTLFDPFNANAQPRPKKPQTYPNPSKPHLKNPEPQTRSWTSSCWT